MEETEKPYHLNFFIEYVRNSYFLIRFLLNYRRNKCIINTFLNRWYHTYQNHISYRIVTKKEEQNHVAVKSSIAMWLCLKLPFIFELHETSLNVTKRKIVSTTLLLYIWDETEIHFSTAFYANMLLQLIINTIYVLGVIIIIYLHV